MDAAARQLLIKLLASWRDWPERRAWYLAEHIPRLVSAGSDAGRNLEEKINLGSIRAHLGNDEWEALGMLLVVADKHDQVLIAELRAKGNRARARASEEDQKAKSIEKQRRRDADEAQRRSRKAERAEAQRERLEAERSAVEAALQRQTEADAAERAERARIKRERKAERQELMRLLGIEFDLRFLGAHHWLQKNDPEGLIAHDEFRDAAVTHVSEWCRKHMVLPDGKPMVLDAAQAAAVATVDGHCLVGARAGSGKTATMVARSIFLIKACRVDPKSILMLAFNLAAADEMRDRLEVLLDATQVPHVMTFHAIANRIVHPAENLLLDQSDSMRALSRHVQDVVDEMLRSSDYQTLVRDVMLTFFRRDWSRIVGRGDNLAALDQIAHRRHLQDESIKGDFVKSYGEKAIANILFENGIAGDGRGVESFYGYEHDVRWNGQNYKPDFSVYDQKRTRRIVIEYFGLRGEPDYDEMTEDKRAFWATRDEVFLEYFPADVARPDFEQRLLADLREAGAPLRRLSDEELWHRIKRRAIDRFTDAVTTILGRARQRRWKSDDLRREWGGYGFDDESLDLFIDLSARLLDSYAESLVDHNKEDFTGLMWRAVDAVRAGTKSFGRGGHVEGSLGSLRHVVVDEFQDFSMMFFELLQAVLVAAPRCSVMAVGDDWQAINEFAGSSTDYFRTFEAGFAQAARLALTTNRRSSPDIVSLGNAVMAGRGDTASALRTEMGQIREFTADTFDPSPIEAATFGEYSRQTPALLRLIQDHRARGREVAVLSRKRKGTWTVKIDERENQFDEFRKYGAHLRQLLDIENPAELRFSSIHGFKGQEATAVILLDVTQRNYPLIHPTWPLFQVFGDSVQTLIEAERRLFYVAVSRPHVYLDVVTTARDPSEFWLEARGSTKVVRAEWDSLAEVQLGNDDGRLEIRVFNSTAADFDKSRMLLMADHFHFRRGASKYWWRLMPNAEFDQAALLQAVWAQQPGVRIEIWRGGQREFAHQVPGGRQGWVPF